MRLPGSLACKSGDGVTVIAAEPAVLELSEPVPGLGLPKVKDTAEAARGCLLGARLSGALR